MKHLKITKEELKEKVKTKLEWDYSLSYLDLNSEEREIIVEKMAKFWPEMYNRKKDMIIGALITSIYIIYCLGLIIQQQSFFLEVVLYIFSILWWIGLVTVISSKKTKSSIDRIYTMINMFNWSNHRSTQKKFFDLLLNILQIGVLIYFGKIFIGISLLMLIGIAYYANSEITEDIENNLKKLLQD